MRFFALLLDPDGRGISDEVLRSYEALPRRQQLEFAWQSFENATVLTAWDDPCADPLVSKHGNHLAVGMVRLDNRPDLKRWADCEREELTDLALVQRVVARCGSKYIPHILGDFAFVVWNETTRELWAARDALGVRRLYYAERSQFLGFASRADLLANDGEYDRDTLIQIAAMSNPSLERTVFTGVRAVLPGHVVNARGACLDSRQFWSAAAFEPAALHKDTKQDYCEAFRSLFEEAVRTRIAHDTGTWAQLSGGLDSSSVVSMAQRLLATGRVEHGVQGTASWVYPWSLDGDERCYSDAVAREFGLRNEIFGNYWLWEEDGHYPPLTDEPCPDDLLYARDRRTALIIRAADCRVLLTGFGSDQYLLGNMFFFADWLANGRLLKVAREVLRRAAMGRVSFWELVYHNAVLPLLPEIMRRRLLSGAEVPKWIRPEAARRSSLRSTSDARCYLGRVGEKYSGAIREAMRELPAALRRHAVLEESVDVRHPFLHRPLVEFGLQLPAELCVQPHARKWILREAMKGTLPESVRTRVGKGSNHGWILRSFAREQRRIDKMLSCPLLADLGCVDPAQLRTAYSETLESSDESTVTALVCTLSLETWLRVRSGRWVISNGESSRSSRRGSGVKVK